MMSQIVVLERDFVNHIKDENSLVDEQPIRAVIYTRVSTEMQPQSALKSQEDVAREFAENNGIEVIEVYSDRGISGTTDQRPEFQRMITRLKSKNDAQMIITYKLDRFFRNEQLHHVYEYELSKYGVFVLSATEEVYKLDIGSRVFKAVTLINNENEAIKIRQNVRRGQKYTAKQGKTNGGIAPLGYDINKEGRYIINIEEAEVVKEIFEMRSRGITYEQMAKQLNDKHYKTKVGRAFTKNSFYEIITNPKYKGEFTYNRTVSVSEYGKRPNRHKHKRKEEIISVKGQIEAIVPESLWDSVQPKKNTSSRKNKGKYLLSGLVKCPVCGGSYQVDTKRGEKYFRHNNSKTDECLSFASMTKVEKEVVKKVVARIYSESNVDYFLNNFSQITKNQAIKANKKVQKLEQRISAYKAKYDIYADNLSKVSDEETVMAIEQKMTETSQTIKDLTTEVKKIRKRIPEKPTKEKVLTSRKTLSRKLLNPDNRLAASKLLNDVVEGVYLEEGKVRVKFKL